MEQMIARFREEIIKGSALEFVEAKLKSLTIGTDNLETHVMLLNLTSKMAKVACATSINSFGLVNMPTKQMMFQL